MSFLDTLKKSLHEHDIRTLEIEFRVGFQSRAGFISSIPKIAWATAKGKLADGVDSVTVDRYIRARPGESCRHVTTPVNAFLEHKKKIANEVDASGTYAIRSSVAIEVRESAPKQPNSFVMQRTKHRTSYRRGPWSIDFTRVEIIPIQNDIEEVFEIEVELIDTGYLFERELHIVIDEGIKLARSLV